MQNNYLMPDYDAICLTARILRVQETRLFELAYQEWYGRMPQQCELEHAFLAYIFSGEVPCWVRAFTRSTLQLCDEAGMALPVTQSGQELTLVVTRPEMMIALMGFGAMCLGWLVGMF
jgi:hypothetical protein